MQSFPTKWRLADRDVFIGGHVIGYYYMNRAEFQTIIDEPIKLRAEIEFGLFIGGRPAPKILGITIDRLGVGYRFSDVSDALDILRRISVLVDRFVIVFRHYRGQLDHQSALRARENRNLGQEPWIRGPAPRQDGAVRPALEFKTAILKDLQRLPVTGR